MDGEVSSVVIWGLLLGFLVWEVNESHLLYGSTAPMGTRMGQRQQEGPLYNPSDLTFLVDTQLLFTSWTTKKCLDFCYTKGEPRWSGEPTEALYAHPYFSINCEWTTFMVVWGQPTRSPPSSILSRVKAEQCREEKESSSPTVCPFSLSQPSRVEEEALLRIYL